MKTFTPTKRQQQISEFIAAFIKENHIGPSIMEIASFLGVSSSATVHKHLKRMELRGLIVRLPRKARAFELIVVRADDIVEASN